LRSLLDDAEYWHDRAEEAWVIAEICSDPEAQRIMSAIAGNYERLAEKAAEREARTKQ
jgi:hypothetical protein